MDQRSFYTELPRSFSQHEAVQQPSLEPCGQPWLSQAYAHAGRPYHTAGLIRRLLTRDRGVLAARSGTIATGSIMRSHGRHALRFFFCRHVRGSEPRSDVIRAKRLSRTLETLAPVCQAPAAAISPDISRTEMFTAEELCDGCKQTSHLLKPPKSWDEAFSAIGRDATPRKDREAHAQAYLNQLGDDIERCVRMQPKYGTASALLLSYIRYLYTSRKAELFEDAHAPSAATRQARADAVDDVLAELPLKAFQEAALQLSAIPTGEAHSFGELTLRQRKIYGRRFAGGA